MDVKTFGGFFEDNVMEQCRRYTFGDVLNEQHLFSASNEEHRIIVEECAECAKAGKPTDEAMTCITCPGQPAADGCVAPSEPLRQRLVERGFTHLEGEATCVAIHCRSGAASIAPFDGLSQEERKNAGQERLSLWTGFLASFHKSNPSALTTKPKVREPLSTKVPGCDDDTGVDCWQVKEGEPEEVRPISCAGVTCHCAGGYNLNTGKFGVDLMRVETTADELEDRHRATRYQQYSEFAASQFRDTELDFSKVTCWDDTLVDRRKCSIPGACLAIACRVGGLQHVVRQYNVRAFDTFPLTLAHEFYGKGSIIELDYSLEYKFDMEAFLGVEVQWSGAFREDTLTAAFDLTLVKDHNSELPCCRKRDVIIEMKHDAAGKLGLPVPSGHGARDAETSKTKDADMRLVDVTVCYVPSRLQNQVASLTAFGADRSRAAAQRRFDLVRDTQKYIDEEGLPRREAMRKARRNMWETDPSSKFRMIVAATANVKDGGNYEWVDVANDGTTHTTGRKTDFGEQLKEAIGTAFKANEAALRDARPRQKHLGKDQFQVKPLTRAVLNKLPSLDQVLAVAPSNVASSSSPPRASWAPAVERYQEQLKAALAKRGNAYVNDAAPDAFVESLCARVKEGSLNSDVLKGMGSVGLRDLRLMCEAAEDKLAAEKRARVRGRGDGAPAPDARRHRGGDAMEE